MKRACLAALVLLSACSGSYRNEQFTVDRSAYALDGDTFAFSGEPERYRLAAIDAPEMPGHCRGYRQRHNTCAPGDPWRSQHMLQSFLDRGDVRCTITGQDIYHRNLVVCSFQQDGMVNDLGGWLVRQGFAIPYSYHGRS